MDDQGNVFDPTLKDQHTMPYVGIPFDSDFAMRMAEQTGMYGVMDNYRFREIYNLNPAEFMHPNWIK